MAYFLHDCVSSVLKSSFTSSKLRFSARCFLALKKIFSLFRGSLVLALGIYFCVPAVANEKILFCQEYKDHLGKMKQMQTMQNFSYKSKAWQEAEDEKEILLETGKLLFGDDVRITNVCSGLLNMMNSKQYRSFQ